MTKCEANYQFLSVIAPDIDNACTFTAEWATMSNCHCRRELKACTRHLPRAYEMLTNRCDCPGGKALVILKLEIGK